MDPALLIWLCDSRRDGRYFLNIPNIIFLVQAPLRLFFYCIHVGLEKLKGRGSKCGILIRDLCVQTSQLKTLEQASIQEAPKYCHLTLGIEYSRYPAMFLIFSAILNYLHYWIASRMHLYE